MSEQRRRHNALLQSFVDCVGPELLEKITIFGGMSPTLYELSPLVSIRATMDIDVVITIEAEDEPGSYGEHMRFIGALEDQGFQANDPPICRYRHREQTEVIVDVGTTKHTPIGPSNPWYERGVQHRQLAQGFPLHVVSPIYFVATKFAAWRGRGEGDYLDSKDLEDILTVFVGVHDLLPHIKTGSEDVHVYIRAEIHELLVLVGDQALTMVEANLDPVLHPKATSLLEDLRNLQVDGKLK